MCNGQVKAFSDIFKTHFSPIAQAHNYSTLVEANPTKLIFLSLYIRTVARTRRNFMVLKHRIRFLRKLCLTHFIVLNMNTKRYCQKNAIKLKQF